MSGFTRPRAMSGTIPSMETTHDELRENTIIIGALSVLDLYSDLDPRIS
jgi:hypothetical protein